MTVHYLVGINFDLLSVCFAVAGIFILGCLIYLSDSSNKVNHAFFWFALINIVWGISNYLEYKFPTAQQTLWALRVHLFLSCWYALLYFRLAYIYPDPRAVFPTWYYRGLLPLVSVTALLTLTPFVFQSIDTLAPAGQVTNPVRGPGIALFAIVAFGMLIAGGYLVFKKARSFTDRARRQALAVFWGLAATSTLILTFNVLLPIFFNELGFIPLAALFMLPFVALISYAIGRESLFNVKVGAAAALIFVLAVANLVLVVLSDSLLIIGTSIGTLTLVLIAGILLIRSVLKEVEQRETIEKQEKELEQINAQQESLLHFISHEIKGYLTKGQNAFAGIIEGDYGESSTGVRALATGALHEMRKGVSTVMDILDASNYKKGTMTFDKKPFDIKKAILELSDELRFMAEEKGLQFEINFAPSGEYMVVGDEPKLRRHVLRNLIENSIRYTPKGKVSVSLSRVDGFIRFTVADTGVGITEEDKKRLFTQGGRGKDSIKVNVDSTGFGLFVAKQVTDAHNGKIAAFSDGAGKGATFTVDLPAA